MERDNNVYYRAFKGKDGKMAILTINEADSDTYDEKIFFTEHRFQTFEEALSWLTNYNEKHGRRKGLKRSDAILEIRHVLNQNHDHYVTEDVAEKILKSLEDLGMTPPFRDANQRSSYGYARIQQYEDESNED